MATYAGRYSEDLQDRYGNGYRNAKVAVQTLAATPVTLYADRDRTAYVPAAGLAANEIKADSRGNLRFFADPGNYQIVVTPVGGSTLGAFPVSVFPDPLEPDASEGALAAEQEAREDADTALTQAIADEATARANADDNLSTSVAGKVSRAANLSDLEDAGAARGNLGLERSAWAYQAQFGWTQEAIQAAVAASVTDDPTRWHAWVPPGDWVISEPIRLPSNGHLEISDAATLTLAAGANCDIITNERWQGSAATISSPWVGGADQDITISGGHLNGNRLNQTHVVGDGPGVGMVTSQSLITLVNVLRPKVQNVWGTSPRLHGLDFNCRDINANSLGDPGCVDFVAEGCGFTDFGDDGITTHWSNGGSINHCVAWDAAASYSGSSNGVEVDDGSSDVTVSACMARNCIAGVMVQGHTGRVPARNVTVADCISIACVDAFRVSAGADQLAPGAKNVTIIGGVGRGCSNSVVINHYQGVRIIGTEFHDCGDLFDTVSTDAALTTGIRYIGCVVSGTTTTILNKTTVGSMAFEECQWHGITSAATIAIGQNDVTLRSPEIWGCTNSVAAIQVYNACRRTKIESPDIRLNSGAGIRFDECYDFDVTDVNIRDNGVGAAALYFPPATTYTPSGRVRGGRAAGSYGLRILTTRAEVGFAHLDLVGTTANLNIGSGAAKWCRFRDMRGMSTESLGTATLGASATSVVVAHGLSITPDPGAISATPTGSWGSATKFWVDTVTATTFTVRVDIAPGSAMSFTWAVNASTPIADTGYALSETGVDWLSVTSPLGLGSGDLELIFGLAAANWRLGTSQFIVAKGAGATTDLSWYLQMLGTGHLRLGWSPDGTTAASLLRDSTTAVSDVGALVAQWVRVLLDIDNGAGSRTVTFWQGPSATGPWTQLSTHTTAGVTSVFASSSTPLLIGAQSVGATRWVGRIKSHSVASGGTIVSSRDYGTVRVRGSRDPQNLSDDQGNPIAVTGAGWSWV